MYHQTTSPALTKYYVPLDNFREQISLLMKLNIKSVSLEDHYFKSDKYPPFLITFDDGHKSNLEAAKILADHGLKGYFYVVKDFSLNNPEYLNEKDLETISALGHTIAVHGKDHEWWTLKTNQQLIDELTETKNWIEDITQKEIITCAAPGGVINKRIIACIQESMPEYKYIRTVQVGINTRNDLLINIVPMHTSTNQYMFRQSVTCNRLYYRYLLTIYFTKAILRPLYRIIKK